MASSTPLVLPEKAQQAIIQLERQCYTMLNSQWNIREQMRQIDLSYIREQDQTVQTQRAKLAAQAGDPTKFQNVTVPVVMPQVEAAVTYQSSVFLTGNPIFGWVGPPSNEDAAMQFQAITQENQVRGGWIQQIMMFFRDTFKYNLGILECSWKEETTAVLETDIAFSTTQGKPKNILWQGNCIKRWDLYNSFYDIRYHPTQIYKDGEFCGKTELMSRIHLKKFLAELPDKMISNITKAFESGLGTGISNSGIESYYIPSINPRAFLQADSRYIFNWLAWAGVQDRPAGEAQYKNLYEVTTLYSRIIPQDFLLRVPSANTVQIWKFIIINHQVLVYAERQTNAHNFLPTLFGQANEDGLGFQTKSLATNAKPFQEIASALVNSAIAARRRAISDRGIYNPLLISEAHINNESPTAKIPLRPAAYGKPIQDAYFPIPFRDEQSQVAFAELPQIIQMANIANGQNQAKQGQFVKGNKTLHEYSDVMNNANGRDQLTSMLFESQVFTPLKEILKLNILQYQPSGQIYSTELNENVKIDPVVLRNSSVTYTITDGLTPTDKVISGDEFTVAIQTMASSPTLGAGYNLAAAFSYLMKTRNVNLKAFEKSQEQISYEQAVESWKEVIMQLAKQGIDASKLPPQPKPANYGYNPQLANSADSSVNNLSSSPQPTAQPSQP